MIAICPVVEKKINEKIARINAFFTFTLVFLSLLFSLEWPLLFVAFDFAMRAFYHEKLSIMTHTSKFILSLLNISPVFINAGPKIFAARIGMALTILIALFLLLEFYFTAIVIGGVLLLFSFLESVFGLCVACKIYPYLYQVQMKLNQK